MFQDLLEIDSLYDRLNKIFQRPTEHLFFLKLPGQHSISRSMSAEAPYRHTVPGAITAMASESKQYLALRRFDSENGATEVVPGTHKNAHKPSKEDNAEMPIPICGSASSVLITWESVASLGIE